MGGVGEAGRSSSCTVVGRPGTRGGVPVSGSATPAITPWRSICGATATAGGPPMATTATTPLAADLVAFVLANGLPAPVLVGASLGGAVSLLAVGESMLDASALVIVDTAPRIEQQGVSNLRAFMTQNPEGFASLDEVADAIAAYNPTRKRPASTAGLVKNLRVDDHGRLHWHWDPRFMSPTRVPTDWEQRQQRMERCATNLAVPTMLVRGGLSDLLSEEGAAHFLQLCPAAEYVNITDAAHMVAGDRNDHFADAVVAFLRRVAPPGR